MDLSIFIAAIGAIVTVFASVTSYRIGRRSEFAIAEWMRELRAWTEKVILELSYSSKCLDQSAVAGEERAQRADNLSALIEIGRFYLPNQQPDKYGSEKLAAYRGFRHAALDPLVAAVRVLNHGTDAAVGESNILNELRREFVSMLFNILGPDHHNKMIGRMIRDSHNSRRRDLTVGGLIPDNEDIPPGADALLQIVVQRVENRENN